jgi:hypothetical protein
LGSRKTADVEGAGINPPNPSIVFRVPTAYW